MVLRIYRFSANKLQLEAEAVDGLGGDLDGGVGVEAGVELDGVADGLEDVADVAGDVDEHEGVELCREQRCRAAVVEARADVADGVRAGDGGAEERDGAWLAGVEVRGVEVRGVEVRGVEVGGVEVRGKVRERRCGSVPS